MTPTWKKIIEHIADRGVHDWNEAFNYYERIKYKSGEMQPADTVTKLNFAIQKLTKARNATLLAHETVMRKYEYHYSIKELLSEVNDFRSHNPIKINISWDSTVTTIKPKAIAKLLWISYNFKEASNEGEKVKFTIPSYEWKWEDLLKELSEMDLQFWYNKEDQSLTVKV